MSSLLDSSSFDPCSTIRTKREKGVRIEREEMGGLGEERERERERRVFEHSHLVVWVSRFLMRY